MHSRRLARREQPKKKGKFWKIAGLATVAIIGVSAVADAGGSDDKGPAADKPANDQAPAISHAQPKADKPSTTPAPASSPRPTTTWR